MTKTLIDVDEQLLADAAEVLGTTTKKDTVNTALREILAAKRRALALAGLAARADAGEFDELLDKKTYRR
ncbi:type II toxin-antitoxin system VapB family antitoxin [Streptomyces sp. 8N706]|uniref:type II toxin-antitoxin system VapB family antitoxin n=1 Tax=Streptomyces sp. 8N706 TaxID=3457416 RepID=UPI003FD458D5